MTNDEYRKMAIDTREKIAKAVFNDKVSSRDIDEVEYKILEDLIRTTADKAYKHRVRPYIRDYLQHTGYHIRGRAPGDQRPRKRLTTTTTRVS